MKRTNNIRIFLRVSLLVIFLLTGCDLIKKPTPEPTPIPVKEYKNPAAFDINYPADWLENLFKEGIMVFAPMEVQTFDQPGPVMMVYRIPPGYSEANFRTEFDQFIEKGPLNRDFALSSEIQETTLGEYKGLSVALERQESEDIIAMRGVIVSVRVDRGAVYYFMATAPTEMWDENLILFEMMLQSVKFNE